MTTASHTEVLIVGAGPTGLMLGCELLRHGVNCRLIEKSASPSQHSKALALQVRSLELFAHRGFINEVIQEGHFLQEANILLDKKRWLHIIMQKTQSPYPYPIILEQSKTEYILARQFYRLGGQIERQVELIQIQQDSDKVKATLWNKPNNAQEILETRWLIACDGAHSRVRQQLNIPFEGIKYDDTFILADLEVSWPYSNNTMRSFVSTLGWIAFVPMKGKNQYRLIALRKGIDNLRVPTLAEFQTIVSQLVPVQVILKAPQWIAPFSVHCRGVPSYQYGNIFFAGDAAHVHSPAGGQGMNTGLQDTYNLAWKLALVSQSKAPPSLLETYNEERHPVGKRLLKSTDQLFRVMLESKWHIRLLRRTLLPLLAKSDLFQRAVFRVMSQIGINYRHSSIVLDDYKGILNPFFWNRPRAGDRAPDVELVTNEGKSTSLFKQLAQQPCSIHTLLIITDNENDCSAIQKTMHDLLLKYAAVAKPLVILTNQKVHQGKKNIFLDKQNTFYQCYRVKKSMLCLIRPDGHIGFLSSPANPTKLLNYLNQFFCLNPVFQQQSSAFYSANKTTRVKQGITT